MAKRKELIYKKLCPVISQVTDNKGKQVAVIVNLDEMRKRKNGGQDSK